ncbi:hypothetical protein SPLA10_PHROGS00062 [Salmonella phage SPLA10]|nr:hypothetical protein SPLA10_PHROGS00062 [Salmonella phage SPLA10]
MPSIAKVVSDFFAMMKSRSNPHEVTGEQLGSLSKPAADEFLNKYIDDIPLKLYVYGDNTTWKPVNVLGSFEGGARYADKPYWAVCEEEDGSISMLENGTNGISANVYYTFFDRQPDGSYKLNATPRRYDPDWLKNYPNRTIFDLFNSDGQTVIWGDTWDTELKRTQRYVALTNGTMEPKAHQAALISFGDRTTGISRWSKAIRCGDWVYFIEMGDPIRMEVNRISVASILAGGEVTSEPFNGWKCTGINGTVLENQERIVLAQSLYSSDRDADTLLFADTNATGFSPYDTTVQYAVANHSSGAIRLLIQICYWVVSEHGQYGFADGVTMLVEIFTGSKTAIVHPDTRGKAMMVNIEGTNRVMATGRQAELSAKVYGVPWGQMRGQIHLLKNGDFAKFKWSGLGMGWYDIHSALKPGGYPQDPFWGIEPSNMAFTDKDPQEVLFRRFGSLIGTDIRPFGPVGYSKDMIVTNVNDPKDPDSKPRASYTVTGTEGKYNEFVYSGYQGEFKGYKPTTSRLPGYDSNVSALTGHTVLMKSGDGDGELARVTNIAGRVLTVSTGVETVYRNINMPEDRFVAVTEDKTTCTKSVFAPWFDRFYADAAPEIPVGQSTQIAYEFWVAPSGTSRHHYLPIVTVYVLNANTGIGVVLFYQSRADATGDNYTGNINSLGELTLLRKSVDHSCTSIELHDRHCGYVYERVEDGELKWTTIHPATRLLFGTTGGNIGRHLELVIPAGQEDYNKDYTRDRSGAGWYTGISPMGCVSKVGPVIWDTSKNGSASGCALYYAIRPVTKGMDFYWQNDIDPAATERFVLLSSQVAEGYEVYFTDRESCLIKSNYKLIDPTTIRLSDLGPNPENKRFNVHLHEVNGVVSYVITPDLDVRYDVYIGYILTNATQIETINIGKVVEIR